MLEFLLGSVLGKAGSRPLDASERKVGDVDLVRLRGRISIDGGDVALRNVVLGALERGDRKILLNLAGVSFVDSSGVGELVAAYAAAKQRGGAVRLCCLSARVFSMLQLAELLQVFDVRENEEDGLAAFDAGATQ